MRRLAVVALVALAACSGGRVADLPPHGEALVVVDTDLSVPSLAARLRVDLYDEAGTWIESRDVGRSRPTDWPASFSVVSDDDTKDKLVMVRVRAYADGLTRDYLGERFATRPPVDTWVPPASLAELCAAAPELPIGGRITQRTGAAKLTDLVLDDYECHTPNAAGSAAVRVTIAQRGTYRFDVATASPYVAPIGLFLRDRCDDPATQRACSQRYTASPSSPGHFPRLDAQLDPGTYWLFTGGPARYEAFDVTLEATPLDGPIAEIPPEASQDVVDPRPRLRRPGTTVDRDETPTSEPLPAAAVDRLFVVRLTPGKRGDVHLVLRGACAGTMARLGADPHVPDAHTATTCVDGANLASPVVELPTEPTLARPSETSLQGSFRAGSGDDACAPDSATDDAVCVPGGAFVFGSRAEAALAHNLLLPASPERIAVMPRFWMDRHEVTVARVRAAIAAGLAPTDDDLVTNDGAVDPNDPTGHGMCTYSTTPGVRDDLPVTCIGFYLARALCRAAGGDVPSEAEWEYAASAAGRPFKTPHPWGDAPPTCDLAVYGRAGALGATLGAGDACSAGRPFGPAPAAGPTGDVTPLGIVGLAGNVAEWTRDSGEEFDADCWRAAPILAPECARAEAPTRILRGTSWIDQAPAPSFMRRPAPGFYGGAAAPAVFVGFRCVYPERPAR